MAPSRRSSEVPRLSGCPGASGGALNPDPAGESCDDTGVRPGCGGSEPCDPEDAGDRDAGGSSADHAPAGGPSGGGEDLERVGRLSSRLGHQAPVRRPDEVFHSGRSAADPGVSLVRGHDPQPGLPGRADRLEQRAEEQDTASGGGQFAVRHLRRGAGAQPGLNGVGPGGAAASR